LKTPAVPYSKLVEVGPRTVDVTLSLDGETYSREIPVFATSVTRPPGRHL